MNKRLLYFNLAIDKNDTSLAFTIDWLKTIGKNFDHVDVISLRVDSEPLVNKNIKIYGLKKSSNKFFSYLVVFIISFVALIILLETFKTPLINVFPGLEHILFNLFETLKDIKLFIIDLS